MAGARETSRVVSLAASHERGQRKTGALAAKATRTEERANVSFARASSDDRVVDPARIATGVTTRKNARARGLEARDVVVLREEAPLSREPSDATVDGGAAIARGTQTRETTREMVRAVAATGWCRGT